MKNGKRKGRNYKTHDRLISALKRYYLIPCRWINQRESKMVLRPWIPEPLIYWEGERKVYGVLVPEGVKVTGENYILFHDSKILSLIERDPDPESLFENLIPNWQRTGEKNPKKLFDWLKGSGGTWWQGSRTIVNEYLRKHIKLPELIEHLGLLNLPKEEKPSLHEFRKELMQLTLWEYLEMTT